MSSQNLENLVRVDKLIRINFSIEEVNKIYNKAFARLRSAKKYFDLIEDYEYEIFYAQMYQAIRIGCEALIALEGYIVKKQAHHYLVLELAKQILDGGFEDIFLSINKIKRKREDIDYGIVPISKDELKNVINKSEELLKIVEKRIDEKRSQDKLNIK